MGRPGRPRTGRIKPFSFIPTTQQTKAILALAEERRAVDGHLTQSDVIREVVQCGLEALQRPEVIRPGRTT
jgi:hypothetical protein